MQYAKAIAPYGPDSDMIERLSRENKERISTYPDTNTAQNAIGQALDEDWDKVQLWLADDTITKPHTIEKTFEFEVGTFINAGDNVSQPTTSIRVWLVKDSLGKEGFRLLTSYPIP